MEYDGYGLEWPKLAGISTRSIKSIALKHCFNRNFIKDIWNVELQNAQSITLDPRCEADPIGWRKEDVVEGEDEYVFYYLRRNEHFKF